MGREAMLVKQKKVQESVLVYNNENFDDSYLSQNCISCLGYSIEPVIVLMQRNNGMVN